MCVHISACRTVLSHKTFSFHFSVCAEASLRVFNTTAPSAVRFIQHPFKCDHTNEEMVQLAENMFKDYPNI